MLYWYYIKCNTWGNICNWVNLLCFCFFFYSCMFTCCTTCRSYMSTWCAMWHTEVVEVEWSCSCFSGKPNIASGQLSCNSAFEPSTNLLFILTAVRETCQTNVQSNCIGAGGKAVIAQSEMTPLLLQSFLPLCPFECSCGKNIPCLQPQTEDPTSISWWEKADSFWVSALCCHPSLSSSVFYFEPNPLYKDLFFCIFLLGSYDDNVVDFPKCWTHDKGFMAFFTPGPPMLCLTASPPIENHTL